MEKLRVPSSFGRLFANGDQVAYAYKTVGKIEGVTILEGIAGEHSLPEESHSSEAYVKVKRDGTFHEMRIYDQDHYLVKEIAYHLEPPLNNGNRKENILHVHARPAQNNFSQRPARKITQEEYQKYQKDFKETPKLIDGDINRFLK